jgi:hypothetical protein
VNLNPDRIKYSDFISSISNYKVYEIKKKRERAVYCVPDAQIFYKVWVSNWTQSEITEYGVKSGFYNQENSSSLIALLYDDTGPRGYVQKAGESAAEKGKSDKCWDYFIRRTNERQRKEFMLSLLDNSISSSGTYTDLAPCNIIFHNDKINFIDFESFRSFNLLFNGEKEKYEKFELDAWWKPLETARRDVNKYIKEYFDKCLNISLSFDMDSEYNFKKALSMLREK